MKRLGLMPLTDAKLKAYVEGHLKLNTERKTGKRFFTHVTPRGNVVTERRRAYYRIWYFLNRVKNMPEVATIIKDYRDKHLGGPGRGAHKRLKGFPASTGDAPKSTAKAPRKRWMGRKAVLAYKRGHNAAYRSQGARIVELEAALARATKALERYEDGAVVAPELVNTPEVAVHRPKKSVGSMVSRLFSWS